MALDEQLEQKVDAFLKQHGGGGGGVPAGAPATASVPNQSLFDKVDAFLQKHGSQIQPQAAPKLQEAAPLGQSKAGDLIDVLPTPKWPGGKGTTPAETAPAPEGIPIIRGMTTTYQPRAMGPGGQFAAPEMRQPEAPPAPTIAPPAIVPPRPSGEVITPVPAPTKLPEAPAPTPAPTQPAQPPEARGAVPLPPVEHEDVGYKMAEQAAATASRFNRPTLESIHGLAVGLEKTLNLPFFSPDWSWDKSPEGALSYLTGKLLETGAPKELGAKANPVLGWLGDTAGMLASFMLPMKGLGAIGETARATEAARAGTLAARGFNIFSGTAWEMPYVKAGEIFGKGIAGAKRVENAVTAFSSILLNFGITDVTRALGQGANLDQAKDAFNQSIPAAALFTVAGSLPVGDIAKNPWLKKALESTMTGTAFAGSAALEGQRDPTSLATSFLTGFGIHALMGGMPEKTPEQRQKELEDWFENWKTENKVTKQEFEQVNEVLGKVSYTGGKGAIIGEQPPEAKPILDAQGRPVKQLEVEAALKKDPALRNAHEKFLADQFAKEPGKLIPKPMSPSAGATVAVEEPTPGLTSLPGTAAAAIPEVKPEAKAEAAQPMSPSAATMGIYATERTAEVGPAEPPPPSPAPPAPSEAGGKEPWEMTKAEFDKEFWFNGRGVTHTYYGKPEITGGITKDFNEAKGFARIQASQPGQQVSPGPGEIRLVRHGDIPKEVIPKGRQSISSLGFNSEVTSDVSVPGNVSDPHRYLIEQALSRGEQVPEAVLKDYPDLAPKAPVQGGEGGEKLFMTSEAAGGQPTWGKDEIQEMYGPDVKVTASTLFPGLFQADFPGGVWGKIERDGTITLDPDSLQQERGRQELRPGEHIAGEFHRIDQNFMVTVVTGEGLDVLAHEGVGHPVFEMFATSREKAALVKKWGDIDPTKSPRENAADALGKAHLDFLEKGGKVGEPLERGIIQKAIDFFTRILDAIHPTWKSVLRKMESGEMFAREPQPREGETAGGPAQYKVAEAGAEERRDWDMEGGITGKVTGNAEAATSYFKDIGKTLTRLFNSARISERATEAHGLIVKTQAEADIAKKQINAKLEQYMKDTQIWLDPQTKTQRNPLFEEFSKIFQNREDPNPIEKVKHPVWKAFGMDYREIERDQMQLMTNLGRAPKEIPNYLDQLWEKNEVLERDKNAFMNMAATGSMTGPAYWEHLRKFTDLIAGMDAGYIPRYDSVAEMAIHGRMARETQIAATKRINSLRARVTKNADGSFSVDRWDGAFKTKKEADAVSKAISWETVVKNRDERPEGKEDWVVAPGGYGEVFARVDRRSGQMIPEEADEETMPMGGGPERAGYETVPGVHGFMRVGYRLIPPDVAVQFQNFLGRGLRGNNLYDLYNGTIQNIRYLEMAFSYFHATATSLNSIGVAAGGGIADTLGGMFTGDFRRAGGGLVALGMAPVAPVIDFRLGRRINAEMLNPGNDPEIAPLARALVGTGLRGKATTDLTKLLSRHFVDAMKEKWYRMPGEMLRGFSSGVMDIIVPFVKLGTASRQYLNELTRFERDNGRVPYPYEAQKIAYEVGRTTDNIFGQMAMDNVAMAANVKSVLAGVIQFPTWNIGTVKVFTEAAAGARDILMKARDLAMGQEVRKLSIQDRQALQYVAGLLFSVGLMGSLMHRAMTGKNPETLEDMYYPQTGEINPNGSPERLQLPSYLKDAMGITHHFASTVFAKMAAPIHIITDLIQNKDYWGNQIIDPDDWYGRKGLDLLKYLGKSTSPFVIQSYQQGAKQTPARAVMGWLGMRRVPRELSNSPAQNEIDRYYQLTRAATTTHESAETKTLKADLMKMAREQDEEGFRDAATTAIENGKLTRTQVKQIVKESQEPAGLSRFASLPLNYALKVWNKGSDFEKQTWEPSFLKKIMDSKKEILIRNKEPLATALEELGQDDIAEMVRNLTISEEEAEPDLTGLGMLREEPERGGKEEIDEALSAALRSKEMKAEFPAKPRHTPYERAMILRSIGYL